MTTSSKGASEKPTRTEPVRSMTSVFRRIRTTATTEIRKNGAQRC